MGLASEFKEFAMKGNVVDLAVGVIIGAAFGKIVSSLVGDLIMPVLGKAIGGVNFSDLAFALGVDPAGKAVLIKYGAFIQTIFDFLIIAIVLTGLLRVLLLRRQLESAIQPVVLFYPAVVLLLCCLLWLIFYR